MVQQLSTEHSVQLTMFAWETSLRIEENSLEEFRPVQTFNSKGSPVFGNSRNDLNQSESGWTTEIMQNTRFTQHNTEGPFKNLSGFVA